jgi:sortase (surface protein transpeptidase)
MPNRATLLFAALLLGPCAGAAKVEPPSHPATLQVQVAELPTAMIAPELRQTAAPSRPIMPPSLTPQPAPTTTPTTTPTAQPAPTKPPRPTANPAVIDQPILDDLAATAPPPTAQPTTEAVAQAPRPSPARIVIDAIGLNRPLVGVGLDAQFEPIVPKHDAAWFTGSATPGQGENVVLWGHALRFRDEPEIPAPFGRLNELQPGAAIVLYDEQGSAHSYTITQQIWATPDQVDYILPKGKEQLTLVSCIGDQVVAGDGTVLSMTHRLITIAEPNPAS